MIVTPQMITDATAKGNAYLLKIGINTANSLEQGQQNLYTKEWSKIKSALFYITNSTNGIINGCATVDGLYKQIQVINETC